MSDCGCRKSEMHQAKHAGLPAGASRPGSSIVAFRRRRANDAKPRGAQMTGTGTEGAERNAGECRSLCGLLFFPSPAAATQLCVLPWELSWQRRHRFAGLADGGDEGGDLASDPAEAV